MKVSLEAYGCSMNRGEAEELRDALADVGVVFVDEELADLSVIFTCGVIETTERHMLKRIRELAKSGNGLVICGCLGDISPEEIEAGAPEATVLGAGEHWQVLKLLRGPEPGGSRTERPINQYSRAAALPIASGCKGECSYCATLRARGVLRSRPVKDVVERARTLISRGAVELQLCAQDTAAYGADIDTDLHELVSALENVDGDFRMRVGMMTPSGALRQMDKIMETLGNPRVFKFLHLPVQSGSDEVLRAMRRGYGVEDFVSVVERFRERWPDGCLSTDIIVGFPGESEEDFEDSLGLAKRVKPDIVNVTRFSPRPHTDAADMQGCVPGWVAKERSRILTDLRFEISTRNNRRFVGRTFDALATERRVQGTTFLRESNYRPVVLEEDVKLGRWYRLLVTGAEKTHLLAELS